MKLFSYHDYFVGGGVRCEGGGVLLPEKNEKQNPNVPSLLEKRQSKRQRLIAHLAAAGLKTSHPFSGSASLSSAAGPAGSETLVAHRRLRTPHYISGEQTQHGGCEDIKKKNSSFKIRLRGKKKKKKGGKWISSIAAPAGVRRRQLPAASPSRVYSWCRVGKKKREAALVKGKKTKAKCSYVGYVAAL